MVLDAKVVLKSSDGEREMPLEEFFLGPKRTARRPDELLETILHSNLLSWYGTVSEFYGPGGTPNGHGNRPFEGGVVGEALVSYAIKKKR